MASRPSGSSINPLAAYSLCRNAPNLGLCLCVMNPRNEWVALAGIGKWLLNNFFMHV